MRKKYQQPARQFDVLADMSYQQTLEFLNRNKNNETLHITERFKRYESYCYKDYDAKPVKGFCKIVDRGHKNGPEVHILFSDCTIRIYNFSTGKLITILIARKGQAKRLINKKIYKNGKIPYKYYKIIRENQANGRNYL